MSTLNSIVICFGWVFICFITVFLIALVIALLHQWYDTTMYAENNKLLASNIDLKKQLQQTQEKLKNCETINENTSDGYHTFKELYMHRALLFSVICRCFKDKAWKSMKHSDGTMFDNMFIVGIETPMGQATYHYDIVPYWDLFSVKELDNAPEWDGHTSFDAIERITKLN